MPEIFTWVILLINESEEIGEKQLSVFGSRGGQISPLMHIALYCEFCYEQYIHIVYFERGRQLLNASTNLVLDETTCHTLFGETMWVNKLY